MAIIAISRGTFSGGMSVAECVSEKLGYRCISREELLKSAAKRYGVSEEKLIAAKDEPLSLWDRWSTARHHYLTCLRAALIREMAQGNIVYHGHAGHLLLQGVPNVLRVRITANVEFRIKFVMEPKGLIREKAIEYIKREDEKRAKWTKFIYDVDWSDPSSYDLVINIETLDVNDACDIVINVSKLDKFNITPETRKILDDLTLASDVRAHLAINEGLIDTGVRVTVDGGIVILRGIMESEEKAEKIIKTVKAVSGVSGVKSEMRIRQVF